MNRKAWTTPRLESFGNFAEVTREGSGEGRALGKRCGGTDGLGLDVNQCDDGDPVVS